MAERGVRDELLKPRDGCHRLGRAPRPAVLTGAVADGDSIVRRLCVVKARRHEGWGGNDEIAVGLEPPIQIG